MAAPPIVPTHAMAAFGLRFALAFALLAFIFVGPSVDLDQRLPGQRVIVTGASYGIGEEIALRYCLHGARVVLTARSERLLNEVAERCRALHPQAEAHAVVSDLSTEAGCQSLWDAARRKLDGGLDVLLLNHVLGVYDRWQDISDRLALTRRIFDVNTFAYITLAELARPSLEESKGSLVVVSSLAGRVGLPKVAPYAASKHALHGFFDSWRHDLQSAGADVSTTMVVLGNIDTKVARKNTGPELDFLHWHSPRDAALAIVRGGSARVRNVFFPSVELRVMAWLHSVAPGVAHALLRFIIPS